MKTINILCASQTATTVCSSMNKDSPSSIPLLTAAIDHHNPIIRVPKRTPKSPPPCTDYSQPPIVPKSQKNHRNRKTLFGWALKKSWKLTNHSPPGNSTRYLLTDNLVLDAPDFDPKLSLDEEISKDLKSTEEMLFDHKEQVVVLKVSLHCRGCERKLRKHLSRMEGIISYNIEFAENKVTVTGNVTPLGVLASISKVKNAELWSPTISSSTPSTDNLSYSEVKNI